MIERTSHGRRFPSEEQYRMRGSLSVEMDVDAIAPADGDEPVRLMVLACGSRHAPCPAAPSGAGQPNTPLARSGLCKRLFSQASPGCHNWGKPLSDVNSAGSPRTGWN